MDKRRPSYILDDVKALIQNDRCILTGTSIKTAHSIGFSETEMKDAIVSLGREDFYKSTTSIKSHKVWQDVYKKTINGIPIYIKFIVKKEKAEVVITSFKEDDGSD